MNHQPSRLNLKKRLPRLRRIHRKENTGGKKSQLSSRSLLWTSLLPFNSSKLPLVSSSKYPLVSQWCRWCQRSIKLNCHPWKIWLLNNSNKWTSSTCKTKSSTINIRCTWCSSKLQRRESKFLRWCHSCNPTFRTHNNSLMPVTSEHRPADKQV